MPTQQAQFNDVHVAALYILFSKQVLGGTPKPGRGGGGEGKLFFDILLTSELICSLERSQMSYQQLNFDFC